MGDEMNKNNSIMHLKYVIKELYFLKTWLKGRLSVRYGPESAHAAEIYEDDEERFNVIVSAIVQIEMLLEKEEAQGEK